MWPLMNVDDLVGASWLPTDGQASPSDITQSLARGARMHGARIVENVRVTGFEMKEGRITAVKTSQGDIACEKVVNCAGQWARQVGDMAGINVPLQAVKHQYIITEKIEGLSTDAPTIRDPDRRTYFKEEVGGLVMGGYEPNPQPWTHGRPARTTGPSACSTTILIISNSTWNRRSSAHPGAGEGRCQADDQRTREFHPDGNFILGRRT